MYIYILKLNHRGIQFLMRNSGKLCKQYCNETTFKNNKESEKIHQIYFQKYSRST